VHPAHIKQNPILDHLDPMGTIMMVMSSIAGFGIGWAKPVPVNPMKFRHPRWDNLKVSIWGPLSNLMLAFVAAQGLRFGFRHLTGIDLEFLIYLVLINLALAAAFYLHGGWRKARMTVEQRPDDEECTEEALATREPGGALNPAG
jgi:hypothetical protein